MRSYQIHLRPKAEALTWLQRGEEYVAYIVPGAKPGWLDEDNDLFDPCTIIEYRLRADTLEYRLPARYHWIATTSLLPEGAYNFYVNRPIQPYEKQDYPMSSRNMGKGSW